MELEGTLIVERRPLRRWVSAIAVIVPVVAFVGVTAWFIRAFVAPPMVVIPSPMMLASAPPAPAPKTPVKPTVPEQPTPAAVEPTAPSDAETPAPAAEKPAVTAAAAPTVAPATGLPMFASLAAAPPALTAGTTPSAFADPTSDRHAATMPADAAAQSADSGAADPIVGAIPIPRSRPEVAVALVTANVPLPRSRPVEATPEPAPEIVPFDRHFAE